MSKEAMKMALEEMKICNYNSAAERLEAALTKQEQGEPVAVIVEESTFDGYLRKGIAWNFRLDSFDIGTKFYTTPYVPEGRQQRTTEPERQWVELTAEDRELIQKWTKYTAFMTPYEYAEAVQIATEAKLKEKNT